MTLTGLAATPPWPVAPIRRWPKGFCGGRHARRRGVRCHAVPACGRHLALVVVALTVLATTIMFASAPVPTSWMLRARRPIRSRHANHANASFGHMWLTMSHGGRGGGAGHPTTIHSRRMVSDDLSDDGRPEGGAHRGFQRSRPAARGGSRARGVHPSPSPRGRPRAAASRDVGLRRQVASRVVTDASAMLTAALAACSERSNSHIA